MNKGYRFLIILILVFFSVVSSAYAGDSGTFESFYTESSEFGSVNVIIAVSLALIAATIFVYSGGTASPVVAAIGTQIGSMMGYSGIAATNAGLALLGGGAISSGGFGMAGGAAVITASLSFGTEIVIDYSINKAMNFYSQTKFIEQSKKMVNLPIPLNKDGSWLYEKAMKILEKIDQEASYSSPYNQKIIREAINTMAMASSLGKPKYIQVQSLKALLYMLVGDYESAKMVSKPFANSSYPILVFVFAVSNLYSSEVDINKNTHLYFKKAILMEPDNPLIPLLFAIYLDRIMYRFNDDTSKEQDLRTIIRVSMQLEQTKQLEINNLVAIRILIAVRYFTRLKQEQRLISSLCQTQNMTIKNNVKTYERVKRSLNAYNNLLHGTRIVIQRIPKTNFSQDQIKQYSKLYRQYKTDNDRLDQMISELRDYQKTIF